MTVYVVVRVPTCGYDHAYVENVFTTMAAALRCATTLGLNKYEIFEQEVVG